MKSTGQAASAVTTGKVGDASAQPAWLYSFFLTSTVQKTIPVLNHPLTEVSMSIQNVQCSINVQSLSPGLQYRSRQPLTKPSPENNLELRSVSPSPLVQDQTSGLVHMVVHSLMSCKTGLHLISSAEDGLAWECPAH